MLKRNGPLFYFILFFWIPAMSPIILKRRPSCLLFSLLSFFFTWSLFTCSMLYKALATPSHTHMHACDAHPCTRTHVLIWGMLRTLGPSWRGSWLWHLVALWPRANYWMSPCSSVHIHKMQRYYLVGTGWGARYGKPELRDWQVY